MNDQPTEPQRPRGLAGFILHILQSPHKLVNWIVFTLIAVTLFQSFGHSTDKKEMPAIAQNGDLTGTLATQSDAMPLFPTFGKHLPIQETKAGTGRTVRCGQDVLLAYQIKDKDGNMLREATRADPYRLKLGATQNLIDEKLRQVAIGAAIGATRELPISLSLIKPEVPLETPAHLTVEVLDATPLFPTTAAVMRVFESEAGYGDLFECGAKMSVKLTATKLDGSVIALPNDGIVSFTLGSNEIPFGLEAGLENTAKETRRTFVLPPAYLVPLQSNEATPILSLPNEETLIIDAVVLAEANAPAKSAEPAPTN